MPETEVKSRTEGYRIWLTADTVDQIKALAERLNIDHKRMMAVWTVEMLAQKQSQLGIASEIASQLVGFLGAAMETEAEGMKALLEAGAAGE